MITGDLFQYLVRNSRPDRVPSKTGRSHRPEDVTSLNICSTGSISCRGGGGGGGGWEEESVVVVVLVVAVVAAVAEAKTKVPPMMPCSEMSMEEETSEKVRRAVRIIGGCAPARKKIIRERGVE